MSENADWGMFWLGVVAGPLMLLVLAVLLAFLGYLLSGKRGSDGCYTCNLRPKLETKYTRIGLWARTRRHDWFVASRKWHRDAWARNRWNPYRLPGLYDDDDSSAALRRKRPWWGRRLWWFLF